MKITEEYFEWLYDIAVNPKFINESYYDLCRKLHEIEFYAILEMDENRAADGIGLRYKFDSEKHMGEYWLEDLRGPCSVFEMMVALAIRLETEIMCNFKEDRTSVWFLDMLRSLGLDVFVDSDYPTENDEEIELIVDRFLEREYERDGRGGLFTVRDPRKDLRDVEIWYQANWYCNEID